MHALLLRLISLAVLCGALGVQTGTVALAQPLDRSGAGALTATIVSADKGAVVVRTDDGSVVTFGVDESSSVPDGLRAGTRVTVRYEVLEGGRYQAVRVGIASFPPEPGSTTAAPSPSPAALTNPLTPTPSVPRVPASGQTGEPAGSLLTTALEQRAAERVTTPARPAEARPADLPSKAPIPARTHGAPATPSTGDFVTLAGALLVAIGLLGLAFVLGRR